MGDQQTNAFAAGEGDRYFERNRSAAFHLDVDPLCLLLRLTRLEPRSILEIGASRGDRVAALAARYGCRAVAVDPSSLAVDEGRATHSGVEFHVGSMNSVPIDETFDVVLVNFVLHWVGRADLLRSLAEIDRLVRDGGHLAVGDFLSSGFCRTPYHHREGLWTYKQDYPGAFAATGLYCRVASHAGRYGGEVPTGEAAPDDRAGFTLLHKSLTGHYLTVGPSQTSETTAGDPDGGHTTTARPPRAADRSDREPAISLQHPDRRRKSGTSS